MSKIKILFKILFFKYDANNVDTFPLVFVSALLWLGIFLIIGVISRL